MSSSLVRAKSLSFISVNFCLAASLFYDASRAASAALDASSGFVVSSATACGIPSADSFVSAAGFSTTTDSAFGVGGRARDSYSSLKTASCSFNATFYKRIEVSSEFKCSSLTLDSGLSLSPPAAGVAKSLLRTGASCTATLVVSCTIESSIFDSYNEGVGFVASLTGDLSFTIVLVG